MLQREGTAQAKAKRPEKTCVLRSGAAGPLGKEGGIRGQTEEGCLCPADVWVSWNMCQLQTLRLIED